MTPTHRRCAMIVVAALLAAASAAAQEPRSTVRPVAAVTARVEQVDRSSRSLTLRTPEGLAHHVDVGPELAVFRDLKAGDTVVVRIVESIIVALQPRAKNTAAADTTAAARSAPGGTERDVLQQLKAVVTIESVDMAMHTVLYKGADNLRVIRQVQEPRLLEGMKSGDVIEITYTRARAISLDRQP